MIAVQSPGFDTAMDIRVPGTALTGAARKLSSVFAFRTDFDALSAGEQAKAVEPALRPTMLDKIGAQRPALGDGADREGNRRLMGLK